MKKILLILCLFIISGCNNEVTINDKLIALGYNEYDISIINNKLNEENINYLLTLSYNDTYIKMMENENFKNEKLKDYIAYQSNNNSPSNDTVILVNSDISVNYNEKLVNLINEKYYVKDNFDRYYNYLIEYPDLSLNEVITNINSNLDYDYYSTNYPVDLSKNNLILVNKYYKLESNYVPSDLVHVTSTYGGNGHYMTNESFEQYKKMYTDMKVLGLNLLIRSSYRSYSYQETLYNNYVINDGVKNADTYSARPGYSEHQTGLAIDVGTPSTKVLGDFLYTEEYKWMMQNAHNYGFILRYPENAVNITGYMYEPWHFRYVGIDAAQYIKENNITFEEYYEYYIKKNS